MEERLGIVTERGVRHDPALADPRCGTVLTNAGLADHTSRLLSECHAI
jgi:hypothetical protein